MSRFVAPVLRRRRVLAALRDAKMSQNTLAKKMGVSWGSLHKSLLAKDLKLSTLKKIAQGIGCTVGFLVDE